MSNALKSTPLVKRDSINRAELLYMLAYIEEHPERWDQAVWASVNPELFAEGQKFKPDEVCGTKFCAAGTVLSNNGYVPFFTPYDIVSINLNRNVEEAEYFIPIKAAVKQAKAIRKANKKGEDYPDVAYAEDDAVDAGTAAQTLLGLTDDQAERLFDGDNTIETLRALVFEFVSIPDVEQAEYLKRGYHDTAWA